MSLPCPQEEWQAGEQISDEQRRMKITFLLPSLLYANGGNRVIARHAVGLHRHGHDVTVVAATPPRVGIRTRISRIVRRRKWPRQEVRRLYDGTGLEPITVRRPIQATDIPDADVVVGTWWDTLPWMMTFPDSKGVPVHFVQGNDPSGVPPEYQHQAKEAFRYPIAKIAVSHWLRDLCVEDYETERPFLASNGVDIEAFSGPPRNKARPMSVGFVFWPNADFKCPEVILEALSIARDQMPSMDVFAFGFSPRGGLPRYVQYRRAPRIPRIREIYSSCNVWLWASREEGFGLPLLEAMACRTPVIATPAGAAPGIVEEGGGVLVPFDDALAMSNAIIDFANLDADAWKQRSVAAYQVAARHTWERCTIAFESALTAILDRRAASR